MKRINEVIEKTYGGYPEKVLQFGEGNFLRAFVDWMIDKANREGIYQGSIVLCQPLGNPGTSSKKEQINSQNGIYTLVMRGMEEGKPAEKTEVITSVSRCLNPYEDYEALLELARSPELEVIVSNTTEAGIAYRAGEKPDARPPVSFPAKVTALLYERYKTFNGERTRGLLFLPTELIDNNGTELKKLILRYAEEWKLGSDFAAWVCEANMFANTLVDRIVTGYPHDEISYFEEKLGYQDNILVTSELFNLWVIECDKAWADRLPVHRTDANVIWTDDVRPYKKRKVCILNGAHTATVPAAWLAGCEVVLDFMQDNTLRAFMKHVICDEVIPVLDLPKEELEMFAAAVNERFANPYIRHKLLDIALNSCSKFTVRCLPVLLDYAKKKHRLPTGLTFSLAALLWFYRGEESDGVYMGTRKDGTKYRIRDEQTVLACFAAAWADNNPEKAAQAILGNRELWGGHDLTAVPGLCDAVTEHLREMETKEIKELIAKLSWQ